MTYSARPAVCRGAGCFPRLGKGSATVRAGHDGAVQNPPRQGFVDLAPGRRSAKHRTRGYDNHDSRKSLNAIRVPTKSTDPSVGGSAQAAPASSAHRRSALNQSPGRQSRADCHSSSNSSRIPPSIASVSVNTHLLNPNFRPPSRLRRVGHPQSSCRTEMGPPSLPSASTRRVDEGSSVASVPRPA